ncbi:MAG TPA: sugar O-acetyltransferase [Candidatus Blautia pullicola]|uniref:Acetyltransferase n=1 Tax=Candidatus Blautia pullicola TaxID=2838498 RepID=A0A9D2FQE8_9FIRM|nr:sugar O-acetyltransferase [Candidatus Blautia pullicola]
MTQKERMMAGMLYDPGDKEIMDEQFPYLDLLGEFNALPSSAVEKRDELMKKMFASCGENCYIQPPFYANWSGHHIHMGNSVYANFNFTVVDDGEVFIGNHVMIGPNVTIATAGHPVEPSLRKKGIQFNKPVHIGDNVWIGAGAMILPGVTVGENTVIGAGSVVTKDLPANVVAVGSPCRVLREIGERDKIYFYKDEKIDVTPEDFEGQSL